MRRAKKEYGRRELNMTAMIDIIFLLLTFFIMTFKIVVPEGDFSIKMPPKSAPSSASLDTPPEPLRVVLSSSPGGNLSSITFGEKPLGRNFNLLRREILSVVSKRGGPKKADVEVELAPDDRLKYAYVIEAITAVTGQVGADGQVYKICDKVKFAPRRKK
ncbi:MAG: biopolymer transporter ExbD [Planctomycetaceae bacterium]|nr:biopolymer transporter ExbD [Planctomycetaceae bacterium]